MYDDLANVVLNAAAVGVGGTDSNAVISGVGEVPEQRKKLFIDCKHGRHKNIKYTTKM